MEGNDTPFAASIAVYPYCKSGPLDSNTPLWIIFDEKDDWTLTSACSLAPCLVSRFKLSMFTKFTPF